MSPLGSRKFDFLQANMRKYSDVIFTSSQTVAIRDEQFKLQHFHIDGTFQEQDDEKVKIFINYCHSIPY